MMKEELKKKFEELRQAIIEMDTDENIASMEFNHRTGLMEVHALQGDFPLHSECHEEYVWRGDRDYPWQKQIILKGVLYYCLVSQEEFDREHAKEGNNDDNQQDGQECNE